MVVDEGDFARAERGYGLARSTRTFFDAYPSRAQDENAGRLRAFAQDNIACGVGDVPRPLGKQAQVVAGQKLEDVAYAFTLMPGTLFLNVFFSLWKRAEAPSYKLAG